VQRAHTTNPRFFSGLNLLTERMTRSAGDEVRGKSEVSGNMRERGNKKRDVDMRYEGRGKEERGTMYAAERRVGKKRHGTELILDGEKQKVKSGKSKNGAEPSPLHSHRLRTPRLVKIGAYIVQRGAWNVECAAQARRHASPASTSTRFNKEPRRKPRVQVEGKQGPKSREQKGSNRWKIVWKTKNSPKTPLIHAPPHQPQVLSCRMRTVEVEEMGVYLRVWWISY
jgi:hypothetical protein